MIGLDTNVMVFVRGWPHPRVGHFDGYVLYM